MGERVDSVLHLHVVNIIWLTLEPDVTFHFCTLRTDQKGDIKYIMNQQMDVIRSDRSLDLKKVIFRGKGRHRPQYKGHTCAWLLFTEQHCPIFCAR